VASTILDANVLPSVIPIKPLSSLDSQSPQGHTNAGFIGSGTGIGRPMFNFRRHVTTIAEGLKIVGQVTADGLVDVHGHIDGEIVCTAVIVSRKAIVRGTITAERVLVHGRVEGPITGRDVVLKSGADVIGDICHVTLVIESGAHFDGSSKKSYSTLAKSETPLETRLGSWNEMPVPSTHAV